MLDLSTYLGVKTGVENKKYFVIDIKKKNPAESI